MASSWNMKSWWLANDEIGEEIEGQFPAEDVTEEVGSTWAESHTLNRQSAILQFVHGNSDTVAFRARLYARDSTENIHKTLMTIKSWSKRDANLARPPILQFWIGDAHVMLVQCILEGVSGITYKTPRSDGSARDVTFSMQMRQFVPYSLEAQPAGETRYHVARWQDYYEMLAWREYRMPLMGDVLRKRHPDKSIIQLGDVIKLPSVGALRKETVEPTSIPLITAYRPKESPQRLLRMSMFDLRNRRHTSHILSEH